MGHMCQGRHHSLKWLSGVTPPLLCQVPHSVLGNSPHPARMLAHTRVQDCAAKLRGAPSQALALGLVLPASQSSRGHSLLFQLGTWTFRSRLLCLGFPHTWQRCPQPLTLFSDDRFYCVLYHVGLSLGLWPVCPD